MSGGDPDVTAYRYREAAEQREEVARLRAALAAERERAEKAEREHRIDSDALAAANAWALEERERAEKAEAALREAQRERDRLAWFRSEESKMVDAACLRAVDAETERDRYRNEAARLAAVKDAAYRERDQIVALAARMAAQLGWRVGLARHTDKAGDPPWDDDWRNIVFIDTPAGQVSWHLHDSEMQWFAGLPAYPDPWDGHDTPEKYRRVLAALAPCGGTRCWQAEDGAWIHSSKSYGTCAARRALSPRETGPSGDAANTNAAKSGKGE